MTDDNSTGRQRRPNVFLVHCHDLGQYLGCYGHDVDTPNIDRLADDGVLFENYFCTAPQCSPSRASMMTGEYPHVNGVMGLTHMGDWGLDEGWPTLPKLLGEAGYSTHLLGFQHEVPEDQPKRLGYDTADTETKRALELVDVVEEFLADRDDDPFFVSLGIEEPHRPFRREYVDDAVYDDPDPDDVDALPYLPDCEGVREDVAALQSLTTGTLDRAFGAVREAIREAGIADETIIAFTTDHGLAMPRAKGTCYDPGLETALVMHQPGRIEGGRRYDELLSNVDLMPTLLELLGVDPPEDVAGRSFAPLVRGENEERYDERDRIFAEMTWHDRYNPMRAVRTDRYKYVRNFSLLPRVFVPLDVVSTPAGRAVHEEFHVEDRPEEELYDLEEDPHEQHNLASDRPMYEPRSAGSDPDPEYADVLAELRDQLETWMEATDDPLLDGPVPYPDPE